MPTHGWMKRETYSEFTEGAPRSRPAPAENLTLPLGD